MTCTGCQAKVQQLLSEVDAVKNVSIDLATKEAIVTMKKDIPTSELKSALKDYKYEIEEKNDSHKMNKPSAKGEKKSSHNQVLQTSNYGGEKYYCPMHCEGDKMYDKRGSCPVCGMNLEKAPSVAVRKKQYTCPMHPEIIRDAPGSCPICGMDLVPMQPAEEDENETYKELLRKFKVAVLFTLPILIIAMSDMLPDNPLYKVFNQHVWNWVQFALSLPVIFYATRMFFQRAWISIVTWNLNMFTLIGIGSGAAFIFSIVALLFPGIFPTQFKTVNGTVFVYFEAATVILCLVLLGQLLEARAHSKTSGAIKELLRLVPSEAQLIVNGEEITIPIDEIKKGDLLRIKPGGKIPVDGKLVQGEGSVDESMITGEPIPVDKKIDDDVISGTINTTKSFVMKAQKIGSETLLSQIIKMVNDAGRSKAPIQKQADRISKYFVPIVVSISVITFFAWIMFGPEPKYVYGFVNAIAVLIIACPCALGLATPMSVMVGVGRGAQAGVLIKNAEALEKMNKIDTLIIDKTGTITEGKPSVEKVFAVTNFKADDLLQKIASLNKYSEHPLAEAVVKYSKGKKVSFSDVKDFHAIAGKGVTGTVDGKKVALGNKKLMQETNSSIAESLDALVSNEQKAGKTVSYISIDKVALGYITITDKIKETSKHAIETLIKNHVNVIMLTGDNASTAKAVANELKLTGYKAECLPEDKLKEIQRLQKEGKKVAMAGDGINDSPALAQADVGIAMGTGTDVAIESAAITLVKGDLQGIVKARKLSEGVMKNIHQNLVFAFIYNAVGVPVAAGILYPFFGILLSPMIAAVAMSFSSVSVITNALRLRNLEL